MTQRHKRCDVMKITPLRTKTSIFQGHCRHDNRVLQVISCSNLDNRLNFKNIDQDILYLMKSLHVESCLLCNTYLLIAKRCRWLDWASGKAVPCDTVVGENAIQCVGSWWVRGSRGSRTTVNPHHTSSSSSDISSLYAPITAATKEVTAGFVGLSGGVALHTRLLLPPNNPPPTSKAWPENCHMMAMTQPQETSDNTVMIQQLTFSLPLMWFPLRKHCCDSKWDGFCYSIVQLFVLACNFNVKADPSKSCNSSCISRSVKGWKQAFPPSGCNCCWW